MKFSLVFFTSLLSSTAVSGAALESHKDTLSLSSSFNPVKESYWTGYPHHRRTPFALSPDGKTGYLAYLDASQTDVHIQSVDPKTFAATGTSVTVKGAKEAGGLVAHNDGFALLTNEALPSGTANAPAGSTPVAVLYRYDASGSQKWKTFLGGPTVSSSAGFMASPDLNGDLAFSDKSGLYAAYFVVTAYSGDANGHFGDAVRYVDGASGALKKIQGASSDWGCSHNTGIAIASADEAPFATVCAEDQGAIWLNTKGQGMGTQGVKVSNENTTNGGGGESLGGMSGSYSGLARLGDTKYLLAWVSRGSAELSTNDWMGNGYTHSKPRTNNRNVAVAAFSDKFTMVGPQASSKVGGPGDEQVNWVTSGSADRSNAHVGAFDASNALVTWEEIAEPTCDFIAMGCRGKFTGSFFQQVSADGAKVGAPIKSMDTFVAGDMVTMGDGRICWPYVAMEWTLEKTGGFGGGTTQTVNKMSFACASLNGAGSGSETPSEPDTPEPTSSAEPIASSSPAEVTTQPPANEEPAPTQQPEPIVTSAGNTLLPVPATTSADSESAPTSDVSAKDDSPVETSAAAPVDQEPTKAAVPTTLQTLTRPPASQTPIKGCPATRRTRTVTVTAA